MVDSYPLKWPDGWPRTDAWRRKPAAFKTTLATARDSLLAELRLLGASSIVISTNQATRRDGLPYARQPTLDQDPGAAVYFMRRGKEMVVACDRWKSLGDNLQALRKTIEAIRGIERWGATEMMDRAFAGFTALPPAADPWVVELGVSPNATLEECKAKRIILARRYHPDVGTQPDPERMARINAAVQARERKFP